MGRKLRRVGFPAGMVLLVLISGCTHKDAPSTSKTQITPAQLQHQWRPTELLGRVVSPSVGGVGTRRKLWFSGSANGEFAAGDGCSSAQGTYVIAPTGEFRATLVRRAPKSCPGVPLVPNLEALLQTRRIAVDRAGELHLYDEDGQQVGLYVKGLSTRIDSGAQGAG